jgi:hypothetical protein
MVGSLHGDRAGDDEVAEIGSVSPSVVGGGAADGDAPEDGGDTGDIGCDASWLRGIACRGG